MCVCTATAGMSPKARKRRRDQPEVQPPGKKPELGDVGSPAVVQGTEDDDDYDHDGVEDEDTEEQHQGS
jgi:hypothetical protein